jgi:hypothetical protein
VVKHKGQKNKPLSGKTQRTEEQTMIFKTLHSSLNDNINISTKAGDEPAGYTVPTPLVAVVVLLLCFPFVVVKILFFFLGRDI